MSKHAWRVVVSGCAVLIGAGCSGTGDRSAGPGLAIEVAPLSLPGLVDACYGLEVLNEAGQTVWSKAAICADQFGDNASSISYVGPCAARDPNVDGIAKATVILRIEGLYAADDSVPPADLGTRVEISIDGMLDEATVSAESDWLVVAEVDDVDLATIARAFPESPAMPRGGSGDFSLWVDFGEAIGVRKSSAQITVHYDAAHLVGKQVAAVVNFAPRQIGKFMSEVLVLGFPDAAGEVVLVTSDQPVPNGGRLY